ncbi:UDP-N-acetylmuramoyl-L-alanyl-D-glutamate--2,6-diaminopimelate ligase [Companilactobacillus ginsenosidimutans]|uniref:UDP-N-acetylmuramyl-tripeptide synthetase n=1 Tax=Companilactobacillus ginsenosidimutans TaxID=1007676 RepID=A0A0H4QM39_9LACO|nr:UDP-N-acetylmuramoyl-L-alanyl-D-glutamate--2,6-diaminopimelate ligase [Companilactobacillus ginsenosidimutans]AKP67773.1 UDP-N-acetylmuramoylalanyl-D-glutamate--2,6-diaminopimelate ligase [Companilactobacillus ginsenosidimutans]
MSLKISQAIDILKQDHLLVSSQVTDLDKSVTNISYNSREKQDNGIFFCKGNNFKAEYLQQAISQGAEIYVAEKEFDSDTDHIIVNDIQKALALLSAAYFGNPEKDLFIIAFTGTKGKTTTSYFIYDILKEVFPKKVALFSTIDRIVGPNPEDKFKSDLTTPESLELFRDMRRAVDNGMTHLVMEVSSQAYKKNRVYGLTFDIGGFLNITPDHIGANEHPTYEDYLFCKKQLLINSKINIINRDTNDFDTVYSAALETSSADNIYLFGRDQTKDNLDFLLTSKEATLKDSIFHVEALNDKAVSLNITGDYKLGLVGDFNEINGTAAILATGLLDIPTADIYDGLQGAHVPGRMEHITSKSHGIIFVDYAHNYASMKALLGFLHTEYPKSKLKVVVGSPGDKGISRRAGFSKVLTELADVAILTTDDPGFENPADICAEIYGKIDHSKVSTKIVLDRKEAIREMITSSQNGDIIVLAAKGNDAYQKTKGVDVPYPTDPVVAKTVLKDIEGE